MSRTVLASIFLSAFFAAPLYADSTAPAPGVTAEAQISDADLAAEIKRLDVKPPQNGSFTAYHATDVGAAPDRRTWPWWVPTRSRSRF